jgi:hypothetical protein
MLTILLKIVIFQRLKSCYNFATTLQHFSYQQKKTQKNTCYPKRTQPRCVQLQRVRSCAQLHCAAGHTAQRCTGMHGCARKKNIIFSHHAAPLNR